MSNKNNVDYKELLIMKSRRPDFTMTIGKLILLNSLKQQQLGNQKIKKNMEKKYFDNRDIRDRNYEGELIIETNSRNGINKSDALSVMKEILEADLNYNLKIIEQRSSLNIKIRSRLEEIKIQYNDYIISR